MRKRTRRELVPFLLEHGYPTSFNTLNRLASLGEGPPVAGRWGSRDLYDDGPVLEWAEERAKRALETRAGTAAATPSKRIETKPGRSRRSA
jgi:hypothetical protein